MLERAIELCVTRRVAVVVLTLLFAAYGLFAYLRTPIEAYPDVTNVQVNVIAQLPGLAPEEVERQLTVPLERALNGLPGMRTLRSESLFGLSLIWVIFEDHVDSFRVRTLVNERLSTASLPAGATAELAPDYTPLGKIFYFRMVSERHTLYDLRAELEWTVARELRRTPGVADVVGIGGYLKELHAEVDPRKLTAHGLTLNDVIEALGRSNLSVGGGFLPHGEQELTVRGIGYLAGAADVRAVVLSSTRGAPVTVGDVATTVLAGTPRRGTVGLGEDNDIVQGIVLLRRGENPVTVLDGIKARVEELNTRILPAGMKVEPIYDRSVLVGHTLHTVHENLLHGALLVIGIVWLFLRSVRGSLVVVTVIPLSLMAAFVGLYHLGMPANLISMGAIDFGILVDGAIVLVENVIARARLARPPTRRAMLALVVRAAVDVARPTFYAMAIIIAALTPVFTLENVEGRIFRPLALTYAFAMAGALVFALTVVPALCAIVFRPGSMDGAEPKFVEWIRHRYSALLARCLRRRLVVACAALALLLAGGLTLARLGSEFLPELDEGDIYIFTEMPPSIDMSEGQRLLGIVRTRLMTFPEAASVVSEQGRPESGTDNEGVNMAKVFVRLKPREAWREGWTKARLVEAMRASVSEMPGVRFNFSQPIRDSIEEAVAGVRGQVVLKIFGPDLPRMRETLMQAIDVLGKIDGVVDLGLYRDSIVPQLQIRPDRQALAREGVSMESAQRVIETSLAGTIATQFWEGERVVPVRVRVPYLERRDPERIADLAIPTASGGRVPLGTVSALSIDVGRTFIPRENNSRLLALGFNVQGRDMGSVIAEAMAAVQRDVKTPDGHWLVWGGEFENQQRAMARLTVIVPASLVIVLALLYGALGSVRSAVIILVTVPFGLTGGAFALWLAGIDLSVSATIGFVALLGQISLLGLLVVSAADERLRQGMAVRMAILEGASERVRAVLLAGPATLIGLLPMAVSTGLGSETQRPFALVIVGGMVTVMLVALVLLPVCYSAMASPSPSPRPIDDGTAESEAAGESGGIA